MELEVAGIPAVLVMKKDGTNAEKYDGRKDLTTLQLNSEEIF